MNISYDLFLEHPEAIEKIQKDRDLDTFFIELLKFVAQRLNPLNDELLIEEEKAEAQNKWCGTIIGVMRNDGKFLTFHGYPENLRNRMLDCFSQEDIKYILKKIESIIQQRNN